MSLHYGRRQFLGAAATAGLAPLVGWRLITPARAGEMVVEPETVRFRPEIEPVVRWIEDTTRSQAIEKAVTELNQGLSYRDLMAGLFLAGIRNIKPRPVGFKFHAVMVINSAHLLGQTAPVSDRLLPMFWALDNFKSSQAQDVQEGDWSLSRVDEPHVPSATQAREALVQAMERWDAEAADAAVAGFCRTAGTAQVMEVFWRYAVRDQRNIGHKPIFAMQCWRTLQAVGWEHAEPVLRSLAFGMLDLQGDGTPAAVGPYDTNLERARAIREGWTQGRTDTAATSELLDTLRHANPEEASGAVVELLNAGVAPESAWDAVLLAASEMMLAKPGIIPLHSVTAANALHFIFSASGDDNTRKLALLQAAGWIPLYRERVEGVSRFRIDGIESAPVGAEAKNLEEAFAALDTDRQQAAARVLGYLNAGGSAEQLFAEARKQIFRKGAESHQYKFGAAIWEESRLASDNRWRAPLAAGIMSYVPAPGAAESDLMRRVRQASEKVLASQA